MRVPGHVYLTGLSGSGKSTVAPLVAQHLALEFIDVDRAIEARAQCAIFEIFERDGEPAFRAHESAVIEAIARGERRVVALGGGALLAPRNREHIRASGTLVYLEADPACCAARLAATSTERRPLVNAAGGERHEDRLATLFAQRRPLYEDADIVVDANDGTPAEVAARIVAALTAGARA